jgi:prolyl 4-hydroxylase
VDAALARYNRDVALTIPIPNSPKLADLILKRYRPDGEERFEPHFDSINEVCNRYLVLLWYLNDVDQGGETRFPQMGLEVQARAGRLLMFPPYWMYQHEGLPPQSGDKHIISTYLLF